MVILQCIICSVWIVLAVLVCVGAVIGTDVNDY